LKVFVLVLYGPLFQQFEIFIGYQDFRNKNRLIVHGD